MISGFSFYSLISSGAWLLQRHVLTHCHSLYDILGGVWHIPELLAVSEPGTRSLLWSKHQTGSLPVWNGQRCSSGNGDFNNVLQLYRLFTSMLTCNIFFAEALVICRPTGISDVSRWHRESTSAVSDRVQASINQDAHAKVPRSSSLPANHRQAGGTHGALQRSSSYHVKRWAIICHLLFDICNYLWMVCRWQ